MLDRVGDDLPLGGIRPRDIPFLRHAVVGMDFWSLLRGLALNEAEARPMRRRDRAIPAEPIDVAVI